ncbi:MAG: hypothetical protein AB7V18_15385 [Pyrinomonadaceae bacterium]
MKGNQFMTWLIALSVVLFFFIQVQVNSVSAILIAGMIAIPTIYGGVLWKSVTNPDEIRLELSSTEKQG